MKKTSKKVKKVKCTTCNGSGEAMISCCTGNVVSDDIEMCPVCFEHLGMEDCPDCDGTGSVDETKTEFADKTEGLQAKAERLHDSIQDR